MKIEKISENQIRFTLSREDLDSRHLRISELAYGSEKARALFQELIQQANTEVGFDAEDIPLMIEAIPMSAEGLVLLVTKVEDPEELDARFSNFTAPKNGTPAPSVPASSADEIINCFENLENLLNNLGRAAKEAAEKHTANKKEDHPELSDLSELPEALEKGLASMARIYAFENLAQLRKLAAVLAPFYHGENSLYKDPNSDYYYLVLHITGHTPVEFNKVCNIVSEYGDPAKTSPATISFFNEHFNLVLEKDAIKRLSKLN